MFAENNIQQMVPFYGVPDTLKEECRKRQPLDMQTVGDRFWTTVPREKE